MSIMDKLQLPHAKLLYYVSELFKQKEIDNQEKLSLKEMVISDEPKVFELLDTYQANQNVLELKNGLILLVRPEMNQDQQDSQDNQQQTHENNENDDDDDDQYSEYSDDNQIEEQAKMEDPTSPLGNQLFKKKRLRPSGAQHYQGILQPMSEQKSAEKQ